MFQQLFSSESACRRHGDAPFSDERERYLQHCVEQGSTRGDRCALAARGDSRILEGGAVLLALLGGGGLGC
jgi:hypothetical protein